jgi:transcriptional regulator of arginine metabolism
MTKQARHYAIKEIVAAKTITSQDDLRRELRRRDCRVTQATLSRDLREMGVVWIPSLGGGRYAIQQTGEMRALRPLLTAEVLSIQSNESLIVIRTLPACANTVGEFIDLQKHPDIIGTVAGDNTLLVIPKTQRKTQQIVHFLKNILIEGQG